ncbi:hypothetical protein DPMN_177970 [Dreissena polymorpha]|uniref:Uncharacterized protein n=1 Tax=Dreissena polymorpha TaxID=45954 RepID=A0A9D4IL08_DREPO|nr:hypothetical protein DPMN_177970 [Dreissena polymorpha]
MIDKAESTDKIIRSVTRSNVAAQSTELKRAAYLIDGWTHADIAYRQLSDSAIGVIKLAKDVNETRPSRKTFQIQKLK